MATTNVEIVNLALTYLGEPAVVSLAGSQKAQVLAGNYQQARDEALSYFPWSFAVKRVSLNKITESNPTEYEYVFSLPSDILRALDTNVDDDTWGRYAMENNRLYSDEEEVVLRYIAQVDNPTAFPPFFVEVIATNLARKIAVSLVQNAGIAMQMTQLYFNQMAQAMRLDGMQRLSNPEPPEEWAEVF